MFGIDVATAYGSSDGTVMKMQSGQKLVFYDKRIVDILKSSGAAQQAGTVSKWLGRAGNAGAVFSLAVDANSVNNGTMSVSRFSYNTLGVGSSIGVGAMYGGPYGALVGLGFTAGQMAYDGVVWFGNEVARGTAQFNNAVRNGWVPGRR